MSWSGTKAAFAKQYGPTIKAGAAGTGIFPEIALATAFIEGSDNAGNMGEGFAMKHGNNVFDIRVSPDWKGDAIDASGLTTNQFVIMNEVHPGDHTFAPGVSFVPVWRAYDSIEDSISDYFKFLQDNQNYHDAGVFTANTPEDQAAALQKAGYAGSSTTYASVLSSVAKSAKQLLDGVGGFDLMAYVEDNWEWFAGGTALLMAGGFILSGSNNRP
jgi:flagellar protein FlgJ